MSSGIEPDDDEFTDGPDASWSSSSKQLQASGSTYERELDRAQVAAAWRALDYAYTKVCVARIERRLFRESSIVARRGTERLAMTEQFADYARVWLAPYARDMLDALLVLGVVPVAFQRLPSGDYAPYVPERTSYTITTYLKRGLQQFRFRWLPTRYASWHAPLALDSCGWTRGDGYDDNDLGSSFGGTDLGFGGGARALRGTIDPNVYVLADFGASPTADGRLRSPLSIVAPLIDFIADQLASTLVASRARAAPPLLMQQDPRGNASLDNDPKLTEGAWSGDIDAVEKAEDLAYRRTRAQRNGLVAQLRGLNAIYGRDVASSLTGIDPRALSRGLTPSMRPSTAGDWEPWARQLYVPEGYAVAALPMPEAPGDLGDMIERVQRTICGVLAVPASHTSSSTTASATVQGAESADAAMDDTAHAYAAMLSRGLNVAYEHAFGRADFRRALRQRHSQRVRQTLRGDAFERDMFGVGAAMIDESDAFAAEQETHVELGFDLAPATDAATLDSLNSRGILEWNEYKALRLRLANLPPTLGPARDPLSAEERKSLLIKPSTSSSSSSSSSSDAHKPPKKRKVSKA